MRNILYKKNEHFVQSIYVTTRVKRTFSLIYKDPQLPLPQIAHSFSLLWQLKKKKLYLTISPPLTSMHVKLGVNLGIFIGSIIVIINLEYG